jgi:hypothetical protein
MPYERVFWLAVVIAAPVSFVWVAATWYRARVDGVQYDVKSLLSLWWSYFAIVLAVFAITLNYFFGA